METEDLRIQVGLLRWGTDVDGLQGPYAVAPLVGAARAGTVTWVAAAGRGTSYAIEVLRLGAAPAAGGGSARDRLEGWDMAFLVVSQREPGVAVDVEGHPFPSCSGQAASPFQSLATGDTGVVWNLCYTRILQPTGPFGRLSWRKDPFGLWVKDHYGRAWRNSAVEKLPEDIHHTLEGVVDLDLQERKKADFKEGFMNITIKSWYVW